jgi:hypothetical protein
MNFSAPSFDVFNYPRRLEFETAGGSGPTDKANDKRFSIVRIF